MKIGKKKAQAPERDTSASGGAEDPAARVQQAEKEIKQLRRRIKALEQEMQESRQLNKRLAEITDVVAEVLLPAEQRDEERLRAVLARYDAGV